MKKNLKISLLSGLLLSLVVSISCVPVAFEGLPTITGSQSISPNLRTDLCNLLLSAGGTQADVDRCLNATAFEQADIDRLCALSSNLTAEQKSTIITDLTNLGINVQDNCPIARNGASGSAAPSASASAAPTEAPTVRPTEAPTVEPTAAPTVPAPTIQPTASNAPIPSTSPTASSSPHGSHSTSECPSGGCSNEQV